MKIKDIGEFGLIEEIRKLAFTGPEAVVGIGDDAAVLASPREGMLTLFTTDMLIEGRHFDLSAAPPYRLGWKALGCSLSDIAAMGGVPRAAVVSLGAPGEISVEFCRELYRGINDLAGRFRCSVVGGDTVGSDRGMVISVAVIGEVERERLLVRSGAGSGDSVWVTGKLGGALRGKHLSFLPRVEEARFIGEHFPVTAMIDLSDGLANDLRRIANASGVAIRINGEQVPLAREAMDGRDEKSALSGALYDGEDFELLFTLDRPPPSDELAGRFASCFDCGITLIGSVAAGTPGVTIVAGGSEEPLEEGGFSHFG